ncbi:MAG: carboxypeptidase M32, partial [Actinomycetota bacterium]|nr:carboxypeptidase M32 [Actinomycetota bacterium]
MEGKYRELRERLAEVADLTATWYMLLWDQQTMMPRKGAAARADQLATVRRLMHDRLTAPEVGRLLEDLRGYEERLPYDSDEASLIRVARRQYEKEVRVPGALRADIQRAEGLALPAWSEARRAADFRILMPHLRRHLDLVHAYVERFDDADDPYDPLLDEYEPLMKAAEIRPVFERLKEGLIPLIARAAEADQDDTPVHGTFPVDRQRAFALHVLERLGFDEDAWRLDESEHPFASGSSIDDIRLTTRYDERYLNSALFGAVHECGHGLYEHGVDPALERTLLAGGASMALHESQSRLWENLVGRSRPFWRHFYAPLQRAFPDQLGDIDEERFYRAVNVVRPSLIRV